MRSLPVLLMRVSSGPFPRLALALLLAAPALIALPAEAGAPKGPFRLASGPYDKKASPDAPAIGRFSLGGLTVSVEPLEPSERAAFVHTIDPKAADPFAAPPDRPEYYHAFRVEFDNQTERDVTFQPGNVVMISDRKDQQFPIDLTDLYRTASFATGNDLGADPRLDPQRAIDRAAPFIFDLSTTIKSGRRLARLLVFGPLPDRFREIRLHFSFIQIGTDTHTLTFPFHRQPIAG